MVAAARIMRLLCFLLLRLAHVATAAATSYQVGQFSVSVSTDASSSSIAVFHDDLGVTVLETSGAAWLAAGSGTLQRPPVSKSGGFTLKEEITARTDSLTVQAVDCSGGEGSSCDALVVSGSLTGGGVSSDAIAFNFTLTTTEAATQNQLRFFAAIATTTTSINRLFFTHASAAEEQVLGFGTQYSAWNLKGRYVPILTTEQGIGRGLQPITAALNLLSDGAGGDWHTTYSPLPVYLTPFSGRALALENTEYVAFDLKSRDDSIDVEAWASTLTGHVMAFDAGSPLDAVTEITAVTGRMAPLPEWVQKGAVVGLEGGTVAVQNLTSKVLAAGVPLVAVWVQDWSGLNHGPDGDRLWWNWEPDDSSPGSDYYGWDSLVNSLSLQGVRTLTYINPYFTNVSAKSTGYTHNYFQEGVDEGYFVKNISGNAYLLDSGHFDFAMVDFTNPAARKWTKQIIQKNMLRCNPTGNGELGGSGGVYGWMHDFGEYLPFDSVLFSGGDPAAYHNAYPEEWSALAAEAVEECNNVTGGGSSDVVFFARSASLHSPKAAPLFWMGDQLVSWDEKDGLKSALAGMLTGGLTGHSLSHSDIGGFTVVSQGPGKVFDYHYERSKELLLRWIELSAFSDCIMRTHPGSSLANTVQVYDDAESLAFFASFARVHVALFDYRQRLIADASAYGHPVTRPMLLHFPSDAIVAAPESGGLTRQFMLGETLLVAPALDEGAVSVSAYLPTILSPEGRGDSSPQAWIHVWTNGSFPAGAWCSVAAPLGQPGVFFKQGDPEGIALQEAILSAV